MSLPVYCEAIEGYVMTTAILYHPLYLEHHQPGHPESPERLKAIMAALDASPIKSRLTQVEPRPISLERLYRVHTRDYVARIRDMAASGGNAWHGGETYVGPRSYDAALLAAGGCVSLVEAVVRGDMTNGFALVRPPGHHASSDQGEGFCLFNNIAVAARVARDELGISRVLIVDWDLHHGQGTQYTFYDDPTVMYCSTHQWGIYPGTGWWSEIGEGTARGTTVNVPLSPGIGDTGYARVFDELFIPLARRFKPELILVSAGYDTHWLDPLGSMTVTIAGYGMMARKLVALANELPETHGRIAITLEGGYDLKAQAFGALATFGALLGDADTSDPLGPPHQHELSLEQKYLDQLRALHGLGKDQ
jgi:acetoin utilization deacetylase AcuC-like enzyme